MGLAGCLSGCFLSLAGHAPAETAHFQENDPVRFYGNVMLRVPFKIPTTDPSRLLEILLYTDESSSLAVSLEILSVRRCSFG